MKRFTQIIDKEKALEMATSEKHVLTLCLTMDERTKSRLKVTLSDGQEAGLFLPRGTVLKEGDVLRSEDNMLVTIEAAKEQVSTVYSEDPLLLARVCYHLGNRHVPLQIETGWCRYFHDHVLDDMARGLGASVVVGLEKYQPEPGAYGGSSSGGHHHHHHDHDDQHHH
ncbi:MULTISPECIES: urease accessory protein UreE [Proteus]|jgi:urease accessory protein|uniref:Urease accessory protein UreE n=1 Tax=Proteus vulgaris TaxID=585 RepID=A0A379F723_PROVU|nr:MULTISPECIES: urease accessory protein UreE [Proteus]NBN59550.1 urease accessory protein UreE [Proteus sp. G2639]RNT26000.1 urease accessory protein UreE [Proteus mirabilis]AYY79427.1 urease accessory protein UreE [Proteus vulgaris]KGA56670.1 urease accessory protein ureE [Proteus vulgaris]MBG5970589.1 urease accessory protein UreE [Proteus vulgaris]